MDDDSNPETTDEVPTMDLIDLASPLAHQVPCVNEVIPCFSNLRELPSRPILQIIFTERMILLTTPASSYSFSKSGLQTIRFFCENNVVRVTHTNLATHLFTAPEKWKRINDFRLTTLGTSLRILPSSEDQLWRDSSFYLAVHRRLQQDIQDCIAALNPYLPTLDHPHFIYIKSDFDKSSDIE